MRRFRVIWVGVVAAMLSGCHFGNPQEKYTEAAKEALQKGLELDKDGEIEQSVPYLKEAERLGLVYDNMQDSCFFASYYEGESGFTPVWIDENTFLIPTKVFGYSHYSTSGQHYGVGLWKLNGNGDMVQRVFLDVYDVNGSGMNLEALKLQILLMPTS